MTISEIPKDESNVIPLLPAEVREPLDAFTHTLRLSDFLDALKAIAPLKAPIDPLIKTWEAHLYKFAAELPTRKREEKRPFTTIVDWLAQFELDPELRKSEAESGESESGESESDESESGENESAPSENTLIFEAEKARQNLWQQFEDKYPCFPAAWPFKDRLPEIFDDDDPAAFIAQFMATFYQVRERGYGMTGWKNNWDNALALIGCKLVTIRNPGWREFVEGLIDSLISLETMPWLNDAHIIEICKANAGIDLTKLKEGLEGLKKSSELAGEINDNCNGAIEASAMAGYLLVAGQSARRMAWINGVIAAMEAKGAGNYQDTDYPKPNEHRCRSGIQAAIVLIAAWRPLLSEMLKRYVCNFRFPKKNDTEEDEIGTAEDDEKTAESRRNLARIQGLADALPLIQGIVFGGAEMRKHSPGPFPDEFEFSDAPGLLPLLPQAMFERVVYWAGKHDGKSLYDADQFFYSGIAAFLDAILSWPMAGEALSWGDFDHPELRGKIWGEAIQEVVPFDEVPHMTIYLLEVLLSELEWLGIDTIVTADRQANKNDYAPLWYSTQRFGSLIERAIERISHARRTTHAGLSPFSMDSAAEIGGFVLSKACSLLRLNPKHDLTYLLAFSTAACDGVGFGRSPFAAPVYRQDTPEETQSGAQDRAANYMRVFHAAVEEGWDEFANAALAYFLCSQPVHFEKRLYVDWRDLGAALRLASTLKGYHRVERALQVAGAIVCSDGQRHYDALCLAAWVPAGAPPVELPADFTGVTESPRKARENELIEYLGKEPWLKLGTEAKQQLLDAELQWNRLHQELGRGMKDWGGVALAYMKPIEGELVRKLAGVLGSTAFRNYYANTYKRPLGQHIGLGNMLQLLKKFERLDHELQQLIVGANIRLQEDGDLIKRLSHAMDLRNQGAHSGLSAEEFVKLRELLFEEGVLKRFIELL